MALVVSLACLAGQLLWLSDPEHTPPDDFISSWAAGRLLLRGENPYDGARVLAVQRTANWTKDIPYRVWYPPWTMPILAVFGALPYTWGRFCWYLLTLGACALSADLLWRCYGGPPRLRAASWPLIFTFWPAVVAIRTGQISALLLLGVAGFLFAVQRRRWLVAGACLPLVAIKPQLLHLLWIAALLWTVREGRWQVLAGAVGTAVALVAAAMTVDPNVVGEFFYMALHEAPQAPASTLGTVLRIVSATLTGQERFWLQFVPPAVSLLWFLPYWFRRRGRWDWQAEASIVLTVSLVTTAYGWVYDQIVFLVPVVEIATRMARAERTPPSAIVAGYVAVNATILAMNVAGVDAFWYIWVPFAFGAWWLAASAALRVR